MPSPPPPKPAASGSSLPPTPSQVHIPNHLPLLQPQGARPHPLYHVFIKHNEALTILTDGKLPNGARVPRDPALRSLAMQVVERSGFIWPSILDEDVPPLSNEDAKGLGVKYERVTIDGQSYLSLRTPFAVPNPQQLYALKVLSYTFSILALPIPPLPSAPVPQTTQLPLPPNLNQLLHQLGLPALRITHAHQQHLQNPPPHAGENNGAAGGIVPEMRGFPLRPLLAPFITLIIRTLLLVYFVSPARKPVFGFVILAWVVYEVGWGNLREAFVEGWRRQLGRPQGGQGPLQQGVRDGFRGQRPQAHDHLQAVISNLADLNLASEGDALNVRAHAPPPTEPTLTQKMIAFMSLLLLTVHPAVWNRRRAMLRAREGRVRMEMGAIERTPEGTATQETSARAELAALHERRPLWVRNYIERVRSGDWVDE